MKLHPQLTQHLKFISVTKTFTGLADSGAVGANSLILITGEVIVVALVPFCTTSLGEAAPGSATIALGTTVAPVLFIAATPALDIDANEFWLDITPDPFGLALPATLKDVVVEGTSGTNYINAQVAVAAVNAGVIRFDCYWMPLSPTGKLG